MRILYIMPGVIRRGPHGPAEIERRRSILQGWAMPGCKVTVVDLDEGPFSIESSVEEHLVVPSVLRRVEEAQRDGHDAVIVGCYCGPGMEAYRELVRIPVLAPGECSMLVAASLGHRFAVVAALDSRSHSVERVAAAVGVASKLAGVRAAEIPVLDLACDPEFTFQHMVDASRIALSQDRADTIVLGCLSMAFLGVSDRLQAQLGVPVVNPALVTLKFAEMLVQCGLEPSKLAYRMPPKPLKL